jgi:hypothetical protein
MTDQNIIAPCLTGIAFTALRIPTELAFVHGCCGVKRIHSLFVLNKLLNDRSQNPPRLVALALRLAEVSAQTHDFSEAATVVFAASATPCSGYCA